MEPRYPSPGYPRQMALIRMRTQARTVVAAFLATVAGGWALDAKACRCRPLSLAEYHAAADHVFVATLDAFAPEGDTVFLVFDIHPPAYKGAGIARRWATAPHSAACGLPLAAGRSYLVFAQDDTTSPGVSRTGTCDGSRMLAANGDIPDFSDVPGRYVPRQLEALAATAASPGAGQPVDGAVIGLLRTAGLPARVRGHDRPGTGSGRLSPSSSLDRREIAYEQSAVVVAATAPGGWYRVRFDGRPAWIHVPDGDFRPLPSVVVNRLNYLTMAWDGVLWPAPGAGLPFRTRHAFDRPREVPARVIGANRVADSLWWHVEVLSSSPCEGGDGATIGAGYVPAWNVDGELTAWYYARGC